MHIAFYTPFKPLNHPHPSGDLVIARGLVRHISRQGNTVWPMGPLRARWIYWKPWRLVAVLREYRRALRQVVQHGVDVWLTYHTYYKAPDLLGPRIARQTRIPYVVFQGIFSTKRRRRLQTWPGFVLNQKALTAAAHVFSNRREDWINLGRLIPPHRLTYIRPGIEPEAFGHDERARVALRTAWGVGSDPVVLSAAMFRPDVKTQGLQWLIRACGRLHRQGTAFHLVIAGDGKERGSLERLARQHLPDRVRFVGKIPRPEMHRFYSAGDLFAFPGIRESLGMVYLESQSCGLPVVAFDNGGIPEVVARGETGFLEPMFDKNSFEGALKRLILNPALRRRMGDRARAYVREHHDLAKNYAQLTHHLHRIVEEARHAA